ncbi:hypothetical protein ACNFCJ_08010 [Pseudomonas sp. NY15364]|uniref:hypothetical protein n=1 Tax=Pseudomonas sp. NY15364 TaxID=3400353 RepID=UPI003A8C833B
MSSIDSNIQQLFKIAESALSDARHQASRIHYLTPALSNAGLSYTAPTSSGATKPAALSGMLSEDDSAARVQFLDQESEKWLDTYFPELQACLKSEPERWLCGIITGQKPFGLSEDVFRAVWLQARDREYRTRNSASQQLRGDFSRRGFSLPPGAMIAAMSRVEREASDAIGAVNIAQAIRDSEIKLDLLKFAEEQALTLKRGILSALADFYRTWVELPNKALEESRLKVAAYQSLNSALSDYHRVELGWEELRLQAANLRMNGRLDADRIRVSAATGDNRNAAVGNAVRAFGDVAASAANAAGTMQANIISGES